MLASQGACCRSGQVDEHKKETLMGMHVDNLFFFDLSIKKWRPCAI
jgi:hypothetical protein